MDLEEEIKRIRNKIEEVLKLDELEKLRIEYLGRKQGKITGLLRSLKDKSLEEKKEIGAKLNAFRKELEKLFDRKIGQLKEKIIPKIDLTVPSRKITRGHLHPLTQADQEIRKIFMGMNFSIVDGPEIESEYYNFDALNIPVHHPARDMWDTFWLRAEKGKSARERFLLRTHTSPMQMRYMEQHEPPFQIICPGRVFRYEATDPGHQINFYQLEGLVVGENISLANMKFIFEEFLRRFLGPKVEFRYRPSYFPFVEPGLELDVKYLGKWFEVMPGGMVHPRVFEFAHYNPRDWQGFAFGFGLDRLAMIKYKIPDIRLLYSGDLRFIKRF